jgi:hypothetical protein
MPGDTDMHLLVTDTLTEKVGAWTIKPLSIWCDHHLPHAAQHISFTYIHIYHLIVITGMFSHLLSHWLCEVAGYWWELEHTCSTGDMCGEYAGHGRTGTFSASRNCVQILVTWGCALSC